jgi:hypothetical protein
MELTLERRYKKPTYTIGILFVNGKRFSETVEDKDRSLSADMPVDVIKHGKVYGLTAIPTGRYKIDMNTVSPKFRNKPWAKKYGGIVPRLLNVPCWSGVLIHPGTDENSTSGCIVVGENKVKGKVINSVKTFDKLMEILIFAHKNKENIFITIK